jgi:hypothetical protein
VLAHLFAGESPLERAPSPDQPTRPSPAVAADPVEHDWPARQMGRPRRTWRLLDSHCRLARAKQPAADDNAAQTKAPIWMFQLPHGRTGSRCVCVCLGCGGVPFALISVNQPDDWDAASRCCRASKLNSDRRRVAYRLIIPDAAASSAAERARVVGLGRPSVSVMHDDLQLHNTVRSNGSHAFSRARFLVNQRERRLDTQAAFVPAARLVSCKRGEFCRPETGVDQSALISAHQAPAASYVTNDLAYELVDVAAAPEWSVHWYEQ